MCQNASAMKSVRNTKSTKHTLTFLKSNYKYKRRYRTSMRNANAKGVEQLKRTALAGEQAQEVKLTMAEERCINAKNTLNNAINQIINTNRIKCEIKLIFKLFILFVGNLLTHTTCHTNDRSQSCRVPLMHNTNNVDDDDGIVVGGGGGDDASFDDTSHQQRNYDKVSSRRCQKAMLHQWRQRRRRQQQQMSAYNGQTRRAKRQREQKHQQQQQQQQQQAIYISRRIVGNQNRRSFFSRRGNDSNWQDLSPVVARLSTKTPATTTTTTKTISQLQHTSPTTAISNNSSGCSSNGRINMLSTLAAILFMALAFNATPPVDAGACWRSSQSNGKCSEIYLRNSTKTECCRYPELFYTDRDVTDVEFFFSTTVGDGMTCSPCALSCKSMQCGWNKKCVKRKGRPKCVCAPECGGAAKRHKQRAQPKLYRGHEPHSEQLRMNRHIVLGSEFFSSGFAVSGVGGGDRMVAGDRKDVADTLFAEGKSPRDIRSLSSEITNINLGVEHQKQIQQIQNQNQRNKMINIMQSQQQQQQQQQRQQSQQKPQLMNIRRVEKPGRLLITANIEHGTEKPVQRRLQIFSNVRTHSRKHHKNNNFKRDNFDDDEFHNGDHDDNDDDDDGDDDESMDDANEEDRTFVADNDDDVAHEEDNDGDDDDDDGDIDDWLDDSGVGDASTGNHRRSSDDSAKRTPSPLESRRGLNLPSRHKTNKNSNHKKRRQHENEMELIKRHQENSNNNNFAIIRRFQAAAPAPASSSPSLTSNSRRLDTTAIATTNHGEVLRPAGDTLNVNGPSSNNNGSRGKGKNNLDNGGRQRERHHHQQRKRKHQKQQQQQHQQQHQQTNGQQHNQRVHKKHKKLKDHNGNNSDNNNNNNNLRTRTSSATATLEAALTTTAATATTTIVVPTTTLDWQTTDATTPVNSMSPSSDDRRLLNHGSHIAKSSSSSYSTSSSTASLGGAIKKHKIGTSSPSVAFFGGEGVSADVSKSSLNSDDSTLLEGIYDDFNIYGFPNHQFEVAVENFHGPHPVCGTDGRTYNTECQLKKRACRTNNPTLSVAYRGHCRTSCNGVKCLNGHTCVEDQYTIPHCIACKIDCPEDDAAAMASMPIDPTRAVCGVDGKTYRSVCDINRMICKSGRSIAVAYPGPCRVDRPTCSEINCGHKHTCLVDLLTHEPRCVSCSYKCARKRRPTSLRFEEGKICGVNNRTYNSWCEMRRDSCNTGFLIDVKAGGECH